MDAAKVSSGPAQSLVSIGEILIFAILEFAEIERFTSEPGDQIVVGGIILFAFDLISSSSSTRRSINGQ